MEEDVLVSGSLAPSSITDGDIFRGRFLIECIHSSRVSLMSHVQYYELFSVTNVYSQCLCLILAKIMGNLQNTPSFSWGIYQNTLMFPKLPQIPLPSLL